MDYKVNFKKFRTFPCLSYALRCYAGGRVTESGRLRGVCPRRDCKAKHKETLRNADRHELAYCHCCRRPIDALQIISESVGCTLFEAAWELERFLVDA